MWQVGLVRVSVRFLRTPEDIIKTNCESIPLPMGTSTNVLFPLPPNMLPDFFFSVAVADGLAALQTSGFIYT